MRALNLILVCMALGAYGCDNSATRQESPAANTEAQPGTGSIAAVEVREPEPPPPGFTQEVFTFKGIPLGKPETRPFVLELCKEVEINTMTNACEQLTDGDPSSAVFSINYGPSGVIGVWGTFTFTNDGTGTLGSVDLLASQTYMEELAVALTTKYGPPMAASAELQNLYGAKRDSQLFTWQDPDGNRLVLITRKSETPSGQGYGSAVFKSANFIAKEAQEERARKDAAADNL